MKKKPFLLLWSMLLSVIFIGLTSKSSPLYPMNDWVDVNCFFTMGRSILEGMVPYRDLYEQKGPLLYFVFAFLSLFSKDSYFGVFLLEVLTYGLFLYFSGKLMQLYLGKSRTVYATLPILGALVAVSWSFTHGGSVEQHSLFMLVYGMYSLLRAMKEDRPLSFCEAFLNGIFAGMLLWIKYTMLGFYLGLALFVLIYYLTSRQPITKLFVTIGQFLGGIGAVSLVVLIYFAINGALKDLFTVYFYNNIFLYSEKVDSRFGSIQDCLEITMKNNESFSWLLYGGLVWLCLKREKQWQTLLLPLLCFAGLTVGTYWGGKPWDYYGLVLAAFGVFGLLAIVSLLRASDLLTLWHRYMPKNILPTLWVCAMLLLLLLTDNMQHNQNLYLSKYEKEDTPQYQFAEIINQKEDATLLNYGFLDGGFYFASGAKPACRYFCYFNINPPEMWKEQNACIQNGEADFIVTRQYQLEEYSLDTSKYELVKEVTDFPFDKNLKFSYYLYQKIS